VIGRIRKKYTKRQKRQFKRDDIFHLLEKTGQDETEQEVMKFSK